MISLGRLTRNSRLALLIICATGLAVTAAHAQRGAGRPRRGGPIETTAKFEELKVSSALLGAQKDLVVYLPPDYDAASDGKYPVLYYLHGLNNTAQRFFHEGIPEITDTLITEGKIPPLIIACPTGDYSFYVNSSDGSAPYEDYVSQEVRAYIEERYPIADDRLTRAIGGISMGGYGALKIAMKYPEVFGSVSAHTPMLMREAPTPDAKDFVAKRFAPQAKRIFGDPLDQNLWNENDPFWLAKQNNFGDLAIYFNAASKDRYFLNIPSNAFHKHLTDLGVEHVFKKINDVHGWVSLRNEWEDILSFHAAVFASAGADE